MLEKGNSFTQDKEMYFQENQSDYMTCITRFFSSENDIFVYHFTGNKICFPRQINWKWNFFYKGLQNGSNEFKPEESKASNKFNLDTKDKEKRKQETGLYETIEWKYRGGGKQVPFFFTQKKLSVIGHLVFIAGFAGKL